MQILNLLEKRKDLAFICIGDSTRGTNGKEELQAAVAQKGLSERVFFEKRKKTPYYALEFADIFAFTSYAEGFGLALYEAGLFGASAVCSNIPAINGILSQNEVSFFELDDTASLNAAVDEALSQKAQKMSNFKKLVEERYSEQRMFEAYRQIYLK